MLGRTKVSVQLEADKRLLNYKSYEDYLESLMVPLDICLFQGTRIPTILAELGYRTSGETLTRKQFEKRLAAVIAYMYPSFLPYQLNSEHMKSGDNLQMELAIRERSNRVGIVATIIFVRHLTSCGDEISGYIDYAERLTQESWMPFFMNGKKFFPKPTDLGYYHWGANESHSNDSLNYKVLYDPGKGLLFQNRFDRKVICVHPSKPPGDWSNRKKIYTKMYCHCILYDHLVRQRK